MLDIQSLTAGYGQHIVLQQLSAGPLARGHIIALLGPNGSGKSTLLKALAGMVRVRSGQALLEERPLLQLPIEQRARQVVYLPQSFPDAVHLKVYESVLVAARASPYASTLVKDKSTTVALPERIMALLQRLGIEHLAMHFLDQLSGGQKQLVGLAQALIRHPRLLLLDEPLSSLDLNYQCQVMRLLINITRADGLITIVVLHDLNIALQYCDEALLLQDGRLVRHGAPAQVLTDDTLASVYRVQARVETCSRGTRHIMIDGPL